MANPKELRAQIIAEGLSVLFMALIVFAANSIHVFYILFPELGALTSDVLLRPKGKWAKEPIKLILTPTATAVVGWAISNYLPYGVVSILLSMVVCIGVVFALRSAVAPAISAGVLPIVLGVKSWLYPTCILGTLVALAAVLLIWRETAFGRILIPEVGADRKAVEILESKPDARWWFTGLFLFVAIVGTAAQVTGWRFLLFPPLIVMAYEMLGHPETCAWAKQPFGFPVVCTLAAGMGVEMVRWLGVSPVAAAIVLVFTVLMLRLFRLRMPPAMAIGLIPFILPSPVLQYAVSVGIGTCALTGWFLGYRGLYRRNELRTAQK